MTSTIRQLVAVTSIVALAAATTALAADSPKQGSFPANYFSYGSLKGSMVGQNHYLASFEDNGLSVGQGIADHMTWHCFGLLDTTNGMSQFSGHCIGLDPAGDELATDFTSDGRVPWDAKTVSYTHTYSGGTGKLAGITGGFKATCHTGEFKTPVAGTYANYCESVHTYQLP